MLVAKVFPGLFHGFKDLYLSPCDLFFGLGKLTLPFLAPEPGLGSGNLYDRAKHNFSTPCDDFHAFADVQRYLLPDVLWDCNLKLFPDFDRSSQLLLSYGITELL